MKKFYKVLLGTESSACPGFHYNVDAITLPNHWNPNGKGPIEMGGFSIATENALIRWIFRGNVLYDVTLPEDTEVIYPETPHTFAYGEIARVNKIYLSNPRPVTDEFVLHLYKCSRFPREVYYTVLAGCAICGYSKTCDAIFHDHINIATARACLEAWSDFVTPEQCSYPSDGKLYTEVLKKITRLAEVLGRNTC